MIITIAGMPGAGKTSVAKLLSEKLGMKYYSIGDILGKIAEKHGMTIDELQASGDKADHEVDDYQKQLGETEDNIIVEGKISWYMIPNSFKILITVDPDEGAQRIFNAKKASKDVRTDEPDYTSVDEAKRILKKRVDGYTQKYQRLYGVERYFDIGNFDFVLDTTGSPGPETNLKRILSGLKRKGFLPDCDIDKKTQCSVH